MGRSRSWATQSPGDCGGWNAAASMTYRKAQEWQSLQDGPSRWHNTVGRRALRHQSGPGRGVPCSLP